MKSVVLEWLENIADMTGDRLLRIRSTRLWALRGRHSNGSQENTWPLSDITAVHVAGFCSGLNRFEFLCVRSAVLVSNCRVYQRQQIAAITQCVFQRIETTDQERRDA
jgi:hypothetical protein